MAITRRQFVTRMGALAAAVGVSQSNMASMVEAFAYGNPGLGGNLGKPRVVWIHGAECTGCSTSVLGVYEDVRGTAIEGTSVTTGAAAGLAGILPSQLGGDDFTYHTLGYNVEGDDNAMNIADVVVDVIDLQYHETVMGMGADLAAQWLADFMANNTKNFVLVVEGALQDPANEGAWGETNSDVPWCSIGMSANYEPGVSGFEHDMSETVATLADNAGCLAIIPIGQCATFGGYPGCVATLDDDATGNDFTRGVSQTGAQGTYDYLASHGHTAAAAKVINVPGCPTNPWWFTLTVVAFLVDLVNGPLLATPADGPLGILNADLSINPASVDSTRRLKAVYGTPIHGPYCQRYRDYVKGVYAAKPGDAGCLMKIGCKGPASNSLCGMHGWNGQQPQNDLANDYDVPGMTTSPTGISTGGHCTRAGHPCMACTEKGYPDSFVPFVVR